MRANENAECAMIPRLLIILILFSLVGCQPQSPSTGGSSDQPDSTPNPSANSGGASPKFSLTSPDGSTVNFDPAQNPDDEVFLILFWSHKWDPNVKTLLQRTAELHERYAPRGLTIIGISYDEEPASVREFLVQNPLPFEVAVGTDSTAKNFQVVSIPTSILVDANGRIADRWEGYFNTEELSQKISPTLPGRNGNSDN